MYIIEAVDVGFYLKIHVVMITCALIKLVSFGGFIFICSGSLQTISMPNHWRHKVLLLSIQCRVYLVCLY